MDHDALWNAIQKKKNNKFPIIMLLSSMLVLVFSMSFFAFTFEEMPNPDKQLSATLDLVETNAIEENTIQTKTTVFEETKTIESPIKENSAIDLSSSIKSTNTNHHINATEHSTKQSKETKKSISLQPSQSQETISTNHSITNTKSIQNIVVNNSFITNKQSKSTNAFIASSNNEAHRHPSLLEISLLTYKPMYLNESWGSRMLSRKKQTGCFDHKRRKNSIAFEVYAGPGVITKKMITSAADYKDLVERRKETETSLESLRAGINVRLNHHSGVYLKAGLELGRLRERLDYSVGKDTSYTLENQIIDWNINMNGDSIPIFGTQTINITSNKSWKIFNEFTTFDIPVLIGYQKMFGNWGVYGELGAIFNLSLAKKGMILDNTSTTPSELDPFFQTQNGMHLTAGFGATYRFSDKLYVFASPNAKWSMSDFNDENYPIDQRFHSYSLLIGVGYEFSRGPKTL